MKRYVWYEANPAAKVRVDEDGQFHSFNEKEKEVIAYPIRTLSVSYANDIQSPTYNRPGTQTWGIRFAFEASF